MSLSLCLVAQHSAQSAPPLWLVALLAGTVAVGLGVLYRRAYQEMHTGVSSDEEEAGTVYVLTNPEHEHLVKVGYTTRSAQTRARELSSATGVPGDFSVAYEASTPTPRAVEQAAHSRLSDHKVKRNREFFEVSPQTAREAIEAEIGARSPGARRGLGGVLLTVALFGGLSLVTFHPEDPAPEPPLSIWDDLETDPRKTGAHNLLGRVGAWGASLLMRHGFGYLTLLPIGVLGLVGTAFVQRRPLRPLLAPALLILLATAATAGLLGEIIATAPVPVGWNGASPSSPNASLWSGGYGQTLAAWLRGLYGSGRALLISGAIAGVSTACLAWWGR